MNKIPFLPVYSSRKVDNLLSELNYHDYSYKMDVDPEHLYPLEINAELSTSVAELFTSNYIENYITDGKFASVLSTLTKNSVTAWETTTPTMIIHGMDDDFVPKEVPSG